MRAAAATCGACIGLGIGSLTADAHGTPTHPCRQTAMPRRVCIVLRRAALAEHLPVSWSYSPALAAILRAESGFDRCAVEPSRRDCAYTGPAACGWFQFDPCRCYPAAIDEARCGESYIAHTYGSPSLALAFRRAHGSY